MKTLVLAACALALASTVTPARAQCDADTAAFLALSGSSALRGLCDPDGGAYRRTLEAQERAARAQERAARAEERAARRAARRARTTRQARTDWHCYEIPTFTGLKEWRCD